MSRLVSDPCIQIIIFVFKQDATGPALRSCDDPAKRKETPIQQARGLPCAPSSRRRSGNDHIFVTVDQFFKPLIESCAFNFIFSSLYCKSLYCQKCRSS